ncbi:MAG TPA: hypothetical protein DCQ64_30560 [Candidatus Rokubacteria bacterium]|nr:hypothetical protein [Candidatus Rokubacteria bacterium]
MRTLRILLVMVSVLGLAVTAPTADRPGGQGTALTFATSPGISLMVASAMQSMVHDLAAGRMRTRTGRRVRTQPSQGSPPMPPMPMAPRQALSGPGARVAEPNLRVRHPDGTLVEYVERLA